MTLAGTTVNGTATTGTSTTGTSTTGTSTTGTSRSGTSRPGSGLVRHFSDLTLADADDAGGKGANLGEATSAGLPVPPGFVLLTECYRHSMAAAGADRRLAALHTTALGAATDEKRLRQLCARLRDIVAEAGVAPDVREQVLAACHALGDDAPVAIRSSAAGEDGKDASFAGMNRTLTNVVGPDAVLDAVVQCWMSLFGPRVVSYRASRGFSDEPAMAVVVQKMVQSQQAGVAFTADPSSGDHDKLAIEGALGLGEVVVSGLVQPDTYIVAKDGLTELSTHVGHQDFRLVRGDDSTDRREDLPPELADRQVLDSAELRKVAHLAVDVENHYGSPQDLEWAVDTADDVWLLQARPITALNGSATPDGTVLVRGMSAAPGTVAGRVHVLRDPSEGSDLADGEILVAPMTNPDWVPTLRRAAAIVTDAGGMTCHAAIVARELRIPCIVGTRSATTDLDDGSMVTVDGAHGLVRSGDVTKPAPTSRVTVTEAATPTAPITGTKVYVNLAMPDTAESVAAQDVDGVGLLRAEFILTESLGGRHPHDLIVKGEGDTLVDALAESVGRIATAFVPRPVIYRTSDLRSNEYRSLIGGEGYEPAEHNPMIGLRGCLRYVNDPALFNLELRALARVREQCPELGLMIPFVRTKWELERCLSLIDDSPLGRQRGLRRWVMAEVPSVVHWLPEYVGMGIDGVSIGSNDLTRLILGVDRDSEICADAFDTADPAVMDAIGQIISTGRRLGITTSLCGQAPSTDPAFAERLVELGITSVSVNPDAAPATRLAIARAEQRLLLEAARR